MQSLNSFIQALPQKIIVECLPYQQNKILNFVSTIKKQYSDAFVYESNLKQAEENTFSYSLKMSQAEWKACRA